MSKKDDGMLNIAKMKEYSSNFVKKRNWDKYHSGKNISMGLSIEAAELMEIFLWLNDSESHEIKSDPKKYEKLTDEIGDILHYLVRLSTILDIDLEEAFWQKIKKTEKKYPEDVVKGKYHKYTEYH